MGIQDRDYYREGSGSFFDAWSRQGATVWLIIVTCIVFFAQCLNGAPWESPLVEFGCYSVPKIARGEIWRLLTPVFLHGGLWHLFFNMLVLYWAGSILEELYGPLEFLVFYLVGGVFASTVTFAIQAGGLAQPFVAIGASGAVTAVLVLFAFHFPWQQITIWFVLPLPVWLAVVIYVAIDGLGAAGFGGGGIGYLTHLGGALFGAIYFQSSIRLTAPFSRSPRSARKVRPQLRVIPPPDLEDTPEPVGAAVDKHPRPKEAKEELDARVDQVLDKVSKHGQESLTAEEREILFKAGELYKKRRK